MKKILQQDLRAFSHKQKALVNVPKGTEIRAVTFRQIEWAFRAKGDVYSSSKEPRYTIYAND